MAATAQSEKTQGPAPAGTLFLGWPALLLAAGLVATTFATYQTHLNRVANSRREFEFAIQEISLKVKERLQDHEQILRSGAGLFAASERVTRAQWHAFVQSLQVEQHLPGILGVGYAERIPPERLAEHQREVREEGFPNYRVWPEGARATYSTILYLEPFTNRNLRAFGYDMLSEATRRTAMEQARDLNAVALSGKVTLVQETTTDVQAGTLMFAPVYRPGRPRATAAERRAALQGWVYSPYRMNDLMEGIVGGWGTSANRLLRLQVFDGAGLAPAERLYDTRAGSTAGPVPRVEFTLSKPITYASRRWTLLFTQSRGPAGLSAQGSVWGVAGAGTALSLLLAGLLHSLLHTRRYARRIAAQLTADLLRSTERLALATEAGGVGIWDYDVLANKLIWDDQMFRLYGIARTRFSGAYEAWQSGVHPEDQARGHAEMQQALRGKKDFDTEFRVRWPNGTVRHIRAVARVQRAPAGQPVRMLGTNWDITERQQAQAALQETQENLQLLLNSTAEAIYGIDLDGNCTFCNNACLRLLGSSHPAALLGKNMHWQIHGKHADGRFFPVEECQIFRASATGVGSHVDHEVLWRADGSSFPAEYWSYPQRRDGVVVGAVVTFLDITERKRAEVELLRTLASERELSTLKSTFVSMVSHELRTPLGSILGAAEMLEDYYDRLPSEKRSHYFQLIRQGTERLTQILENMLLQGELHAGRLRFHPKATDVGELCRALVARVQHDFPQHPPAAFAMLAPAGQTLVDEHLLAYMLDNLLRNAYKYSPRLTPVQLSVRRVEEEWVFEVRDQGIGIAAADQPLLFAAFRRGGNVGTIKGTGVGLFIVRKCAELHGGRVELQSQLDQGSSFTLHLPWQSVADAAPGPEAGPPPEHVWTI